ncbi:MAG: hypothetical protein H6624_02515 [Bdellovibrionaceae bacterium]|nr:hypothetical protein [Bdellovibrionales bacterium]MCB9083184.1 hypothetical protein [Pseudobdellovibrionaceae bacterium]
MIKLCLLVLVGLSQGMSAWGARLQDSEFFDYDLRFTNPSCRTYYYPRGVTSNSGESLRAKPKNAFCSSSDASRSAARKGSPEYKILEWINSPETKEIFFTFLSFSNGRVAEALCQAAKRGVKITFSIDTPVGTPEEQERKVARAKELEQCRPRGGGPGPTFLTRGHEGGILWSHNKLIIINPGSKAKYQLAYASANLSSGTVTHHENWHFVTTHASTYFAQVHKCLMNGMIDYGRSDSAYSRYIQNCRRAIAADEESDIKVFLVPGEGEQAEEAIVDNLKAARSVDMATHRFSLSSLRRVLRDKLAQSGFSARLIADDDVYWEGTNGEDISPNTPSEFRNLKRLERRGLDLKYMETNHWERQLHHNKFIIFDYAGDRQDKVFTGAGNFTGNAFSVNYENYYLISIPQVVDQFKKQYRYMWDRLATAEQDLPSENVEPGRGSR